jgi:hypothetical protein
MLNGRRVASFISLDGHSATPTLPIEWSAPPPSLIPVAQKENTNQQKKSRNRGKEQRTGKTA